MLKPLVHTQHRSDSHASRHHADRTAIVENTTTKPYAPAKTVILEHHLNVGPSASSIQNAHPKRLASTTSARILVQIRAALELNVIPRITTQSAPAHLDLTVIHSLSAREYLSYTSPSQQNVHHLAFHPHVVQILNVKWLAITQRVPAWNTSLAHLQTAVPNAYSTQTVPAKKPVSSKSVWIHAPDLVVSKPNVTC